MELQELNVSLINTKDEICQKFGFTCTQVPIANWPSDDTKFLLADEVFEIAKQLIERFRPDLRSYTIGYVFKQKASKKGDGYTLGQAKVESDLQKTLHGYDATIIIGFDTWLELEIDQKFRLIHHELQHYEVDPEKDKLVIVDHVTKEFPATIEIFGPGDDSDVAFIRAYQKFQKDNGRF